MRLHEILQKSALIDNLKGETKKEVLQEFSGLAETVNPVLKQETVFQVLVGREKLGSTGVGNGVAIPHGKVASLDKIIALFGRSKTGIDFESHDQKKTHLFFVLLAPESAIGNHLQALARLSRLLKEQTVRDKIMAAPFEELYDILIQEDAKI